MTELVTLGFMYLQLHLGTWGCGSLAVARGCGSGDTGLPSWHTVS